MTEIFTDSYFNNVQLMKLVSSAESLLQHLYDIVTSDNKLFIDQWLCFKQEFDACANFQGDINGNLNENKFLFTFEEKKTVNNQEKSFTSSRSSNSFNSEDTADSDKEDDVSSSNEKDKRDECLNLESEFEVVMDRYSKELELYTESLTYQWFHNLNHNLYQSTPFQNNRIEDCSGDNEDSSRYFENNLHKEDYLNSNAAVVDDCNWYSNVKNGSFQFCRFCANETTECYPASSMALSEQIAYLRTIKEPLLQSCQKITSHTKGHDVESNIDFKKLVLYQEIVDLIDTSIEVKNNPNTINQKTQDLINTNYLVYSVVCNCLKTLSSEEIRYLFIIFVNKVADLRVNTSPLDKLILQLDNIIVDKEIRLRYLNKSYVKLKETYVSLRSKNDQCKVVTIRNSPFENVCDNIAPLRYNSSEQNTSNTSHNALIEETIPLLPLSGSIPDRSWKTLQRNVTSKIFGVTRQGNKLVIQQKKTPKSPPV